MVLMRKKKKIRMKRVRLVVANVIRILCTSYEKEALLRDKTELQKSRNYYCCALLTIIVYRQSLIIASLKYFNHTLINLSRPFLLYYAYEFDGQR